ncbi:insulinase family protein [Blastopirellula marina]|uniref:Insulinase family protein n=1 Tax=Blastopirellula marina TaxID=124 RepID=A0A2S8F0U0_9BACT|nr:MULTISPECIES: pitrilysin family protein [Pirellulaceae]PQO25737.1 insulinase family protein [Blastopirellula marina]RCS43420.1 insulinase family protein [Bremerella cremea]
MKFRQATLDNGLDIVAEVNPNAYSLATAFFVKTGSRDESAEVAGVSHFLEHMVFKGTARRTAEDVNRELDELGAQSNAFTSEEQTVYYAVVLPELQSQIVDLLADIMRPTLRQEDFDTEKKVILEEIMKYDDQPPYGGHEKSMAAWFGKHPLGNSVLGTQQSVGDLSQQQMMAYFQQRYSPTNMTLVATGNVDFDKLVDQANQLCGSWKKYNVSRITDRPVGQSNFQLVTKETSIQQYVIQLAESPGSEDEARYAARLLATIMGDDVGSRFFWELVDPGLAEFAAMESYEFQGCGVMMNYVCCAPQDAQRVLEVVNHEVEKLMTDGITQRELDLAKNKVCSHVVLRSERPSSRLFSVGSSWTQRKSLRTVKETVESYQKVKLEDIGRLLEKYDLRKTSTTAVGPLTALHLP